MNEPQPQVRVEPDFERTWPGMSALATECILNVHVLAGQLEEYGQTVMRRHGIPTIAAFNVLAILHGSEEPLAPSVIASRMIVSRPTMTGILHTLERRGLIRRTPHGTDRRMSLIEITAEGRRRVEQLLPVLHEAERSWMSCLDVGEQETLLHLLARLQANEPA